MPEAATYIIQLDPTLPLAEDFVNEGDDIFKMVKAVLKNTLPNANGPITPTPTEFNRLVGLAGNIRTDQSAPLPGMWSLIATTTVTGTPSTVDFVHGTGGVSIDTTCDEYMVTFDGLSPANNTDLRLSLSRNAGATWAYMSNINTTFSNVVSGTASASQSGLLTYVSVTGGTAVQGSTGNVGYYLSGKVSIRQPQDATTHALVFSECIHNLGNSVCRASANAGVSTAFNGIRFSWGSGAFQTFGKFRLFGRRTA